MNAPKYRLGSVRLSAIVPLQAAPLAAIILLFFACSAMWAQEPNYQVALGYSAQKACASAGSKAQSGKIQMDQLTRLAAKAESVNSVALDQSMLQLASGAVHAGKDQQVRHLLGQLKGVYVKDFEFAKPGEYSQADVNEILCQVEGHSWEQIVSSVNKRSHKTDAIYVLHDANTFKGILIVSAEPRELAVVNIVGPINPRDLSRMQGMFGIPKAKLPSHGSPGPRKP